MAQFNPVALTPESYNADIIVEKDAPPPLPAGCNATMDGGVNNTGYTWYETGYNTGAPDTGLPAAGSTLVHASDPARSYLMPPSWQASNAVLMSPQTTTGTLTLTTPASCTQLSVLASSGGGACVMGYTVYYADSTTETGSLTAGDWFNGTNPAFTSNGRVGPDSAAFDAVSTGNPRLYAVDLMLGSTSPVTKVDFTYTSGGRGAIFALTGLDETGDWIPLPVTGFTRDIVLGVADPRVEPLTSATTVSMDGGTANNGNTWYERGYYAQLPETGLPPEGSVFTSTALTDHHYQMPADYSANNAIYVDSVNRTATITLATPGNYSALSFLNATANGAVTIQCTMHYQDSTTEVQTFTAKDWFNGQPFAYNSSGRVNLSNRSLNNFSNGVNPRLYEAEFFLNNTVSPIVSVDLEFLTGGGNARVAVLAVSATAGSVRPIYGDVPQNTTVYQGTPVTFAATITGGTTPITSRWQKGVNGVFTDVVDGGNITGAATPTLTIDPPGYADNGQYQLVSTNVAGTTTTVPVTLRVINPLPDITQPGDPVEAFGGNFPATETPANAISNTGLKYLNFGSGPNAGAPPFAGPAGLTVTPSVGASVATGLRVYTANDTVGRDPVDYTLEGSNDGGATWTVISTGAISLPDARNAPEVAAFDPMTQPMGEVNFTNTTQYTSYRVGFSGVKDAAAVNSVQIGELELLGTFTPPSPALTIVALEGGVIEVRTNRTGTLQSSTVLSGTGTVWTDLQEIVPGTAYSFTPDPASEPRSFYRLLYTE